MIVVKFAKDGQEYELPAYPDEDSYARALLATMTGVPLARIVSADITPDEMQLITEAGKSLGKCALWVGMPRPKPNLRVVK